LGERGFHLVPVLIVVRDRGGLGGLDDVRHVSLPLGFWVLIPLGAFGGAEEKVSPSEVAGRQDPLASAPFLAERRCTLVGGAQGEDQQPTADDDTEAAQHRLSGGVDDVGDAGARGVRRIFDEAAWRLTRTSAAPSPLR